LRGELEMKAPGGALGRIFWFITKATSEDKEEIERELPFAVMIFTLMAASGVSLYGSWKKMRKLNFLPKFKKEADEVVRQVDVLGKDPLTVMHSRAENTASKLYRNFLGGFISSIRSGGRTVDYMRSELKSIFELRSIALNRSIEKIATLVEAYAVMLIVTLCAYILFVVFSSTNMMELLTKTSIPNSPIMAYLIAFLFMPLISFIFILAAHNMQKSPFPNLKDLYKKAMLLVFAVGVPVCLICLVQSFSSIVETIGLTEFVTIGLVTMSLPTAIQYYRIAKVNFNADDSIPSFIRDVTESQKIGLSPEKSIIQATRRKDYGHFSELLELVRSQIEWGIPLRKTFENFREKIRSWFAVVNFAMLVETIEIGGNPTQALEILSEYSEREREVQINKRALLKPYIILAFVWSILIAVTTTIVALTTYLMTSLMSSSLSPVMISGMQNQMGAFSVGIVLQCWISGFFIGKISEGNFAAGFKHSAMLAATAYVSLVLSRNFLAGAFGIPVSA
jgi:flagellar protein FlaJ